jgi:hypothetical protein
MWVDSSEDIARPKHSCTSLKQSCTTMYLDRNVNVAKAWTGMQVEEIFQIGAYQKNRRLDLKRLMSIVL